MKKWLALLLFCLIVSASFSQADSTIQHLTVYKTFGGAHFEYQRDTAIYYVSPKQVLLILKDDPLAYAEFKKAKSSYTWAGILGFTGGVMIAFPVGTAIAGGEPEWGLALGGSALIAASLHFISVYRHHAWEAAEIYNKKHTAFRPRVKFYYSGIGVKLVLRF